MDLDNFVKHGLDEWPTVLLWQKGGRPKSSGDVLHSFPCFIVPFKTPGTSSICLNTRRQILFSSNFKKVSWCFILAAKKTQKASVQNKLVVYKEPFQTDSANDSLQLAVVVVVVVSPGFEDAADGCYSGVIPIAKVGFTLVLLLMTVWHCRDYRLLNWRLFNKSSIWSMRTCRMLLMFHPLQQERNVLNIELRGFKLKVWSTSNICLTFAMLGCVGSRRKDTGKDLNRIVKRILPPFAEAEILKKSKEREERTMQM